jgi:hypothetical protein
MAKTIKVINRLGGQQVVNPLPVTVPVFAGGTSSIKTGMLVITDAVNPGYWLAAPDATDTDTAINVGVATSDSTETATANGTVTIDTADEMLVSVKANVPGSLATALLGIAYVLKVTGSDYMVDESNATKGIFNIVSYDNTTDGNCICVLKGHWRG